MVRFRNTSTQLAFHTIVESWDHLDLIADSAKDSAELGRKIHDSFANAFGRVPCPLVGYFCRQGMQTIDFRQVADELLVMIARQRQHQSHRLAQEGGPES